MPSSHPLHPHRYRALWISDLHLGSKDCKADFLLDFLRTVATEQLYLVGDIVDIQSIQRNGLYWPQSHNDVIRAVLDKAQRGTRVVYIPGNHDWMLREHQASFGKITLARRHVHATATGKRLLVVHGDEFDAVIRCSRLGKLFGSLGYDFLLWCNRWLNRGRQLVGLPYWSLAAYLKIRVSQANRHIAHFEAAAVREARRLALDGVVCGHIHRANLAVHEGILYCNDGDWVESCTALAEDRHGELHLLHWTDHAQRLAHKGGLRDTTAKTRQRVA